MPTVNTEILQYSLSTFFIEENEFTNRKFILNIFESNKQRK